MGKAVGPEVVAEDIASTRSSLVEKKSHARRAAAMPAVSRRMLRQAGAEEWFALGVPSRV